MKAFIRVIRRRRRKQNNFSLANSAVGIGCTSFISIFIVGSILLFTWFYASITKDLPSIDIIPSLLEPPNGLYLHPTIIYDRSGTHPLAILENPAISQRQYLFLDNNQPLPQYIPNAFIAATDPTFWSHPGFILFHPESNKKTITQQLCDQLLLDKEPTSWKRDIREKLLAFQLTEQVGRVKILEWYLNNVFFGRLVYGLDSAAKVYFGKNPNNLTLAEAALLAGVANSPALNPHDTPKAAIEHQHDVLDKMVEYGFISKKEAELAKEKHLDFTKPTEETNEIAKAFTNLALSQLTNHIAEKRINRGGFEIITSLDYNLQIQALCAQQIQSSRLSEDRAEPDNIQGYPCEIGRLVQTFPLSDSPPEDLETSIAVFDQSSGELLALAENNSSLHESPSITPRPAGTMITPFIMLTAFTRGYNPSSLVWDIPHELINTEPTIQNPDHQFHGPIRLRIAFANDYLNAVDQILEQVGENNAVLTAHQLGMYSLHSPLLPNGESTTLIELTQAYGTIANQGVNVGWRNKNSNNNLNKLDPICIKEVIDYSGQIWFHLKEPERIPVISPQISYLITHVLSDEVSKWQSLGHPNLLETGRQTAVKIGFSPNYSNVWTIGYTPQILVSTWAGLPENHPRDKSSPISPKIPASLWRAMIQYITTDLPPTVFHEPSGISKVLVCDPSGMLPTQQCPSLVNEIFINGNEPQQYDTLFQTLRVNRETNRLATIFTPPELIDEITYLIIPPEGVQWAKEAGVPLPPSEYDVIYAPQPNPTAKIVSPPMFGYVHGNVKITGVASGADFVSYRLQIGKGLNPKTWISITPDRNEPVNNGILSVWNTENFEEGLYALQLIVLRKDQHIDTSTIQVTLDNQKPQISVPYPKDGETIQYKPGDILTLRAYVTDNTGISQVSFYLDSFQIKTITTPPFAIPWKTEPGTHSLKVVVQDLAGNISQLTLQFQILR